MAKIKIGVDLGFGSVKLAGHGAAIIAPTQVVRASASNVNVNVFDGQKRTKNDGDVRLIETDGAAYWVGLGAYAKNITANPIEEYGIERLTSDSHMKLVVYSAISSTEITSRDELQFFVGLPFVLASGDAAKNNVRAVKEWLLGEHRWTVNRRERCANVVSVKATSQAMGAYCDYALNEFGESQGLIAQDAPYGVLSIGFGTVEAAVIVNDAIQDAEGFPVGVQSLLQSMRHDGQSFSELDTKLRTGALHLNGASDDWRALVRGKVGGKWRNLLPRMDKVICVGGGIRFMRNELKQMFGDKMWTPETEEDEVTSVARGLSKLAESL